VKLGATFTFATDPARVQATFDLPRLIDQEPGHHPGRQALHLLGIVEERVEEDHLAAYFGHLGQIADTVFGRARNPTGSTVPSATN
jgi:hypothetical protein